MIDRAPGGTAPRTCKHCGRQFAFIQDFTPAYDVCHYCGPFDVREESKRLIAAASAEPVEKQGGRS